MSLLDFPKEKNQSDICLRDSLTMSKLNGFM